MSVPLPQIKKGYIRGVRGVIITPINEDGADKEPTSTPYGMKTAQRIGVGVVSEAGGASVLRGGDKVLAYVKDPDTVVAVNLTLLNARFDAEAIKVLAGGTLITKTEDLDEQVVGWKAPSIEEQQTPPYFKAEVYAASHGSRGQVEGYIKYIFHYCRATFGDETLEDNQWSVPEMRIEVLENPTLTGGLYDKEFVDTLPAKLN